MSLKKISYLRTLTAGALIWFFCPNVHAQMSNLWGSGAMQGGMVCPYQTQTASNATSMSDDEREARQNLTSLKSDLKEARKKVTQLERRGDLLKRRVERYLDPSISDFLLGVHVDTSQTCDHYKTAFPQCLGAQPPPPPAAVASGDVAATPAPAAVDTSMCGGLQDVPGALRSKWTTPTGGYCSSTGPGAMNTNAICSDSALRNSERRSFSVSDCSRAISDYQKNKRDLTRASTQQDRLEGQVEDAQFSIQDAREQARLDRQLEQTEGGCPDCDREARGYSYQRPRRDWLSTFTNVLGGVAMIGIGRNAENAANEYNAQAGWPSTQSYGYPFYQAGISGVINGLVGPGAYGCSAGIGGAGFPYGAGVSGSLYGGANGAYGPFAANGGAFGYPANMYGSPWGGGMYNPGFGINGQINGPMGGLYGQYGMPNNGAMCFTYPCNVGGGGGYNPYGMPGLGGQFGLQIGGGGGMPGMPGMPGYNPYGLGGLNGQFGMNGQLSAQYQMQMLQMQQQMQQQYYQQQQQYYQAQLQYQMQVQQQAYQRQQQALQIQMQMAQLNAQLQQLQSQSYYGGGYSPYGSSGGGLSAGFNFGLGFNGGLTVGAPAPGGFPGGSYPGGSYPGGSYPGGSYPGGSYPGGSYPGGSYPGVPVTDPNLGGTVIRGR